MKRILFICYLLFAGEVISAPGIIELYIITSIEINYYDRLFNAVVAVESGGDIYAFNFRELASGPAQIRPIRINDYNRLMGTNYTIVDCFDLDFSRKIFIYFAKDKTYEQTARDWNGSGEMTIDYWNLIKAKL